MMGKKLIRVVQVAAFCAVLALAVAGVSRVLMRKESITRYTPMFEQAEDFDVLFMGNSHMTNGVFPMELWRDYGITSYNAAGYGNTVPVSYWAMVNALDYVKPKLIVIDTLDVGRGDKLSGSGGDVHTTFDCYPLTQNKIRAIEDLMDNPTTVDDNGTPFTELKWEYYFPLGKYHERWNELGEQDFNPQMTTQLGAVAMIGVAEPNDYDIIWDDEYEEESGHGYIYLRRMIEECQLRGIEVLLVHLPYPATQQQQQSANTARHIAEGYGVDLIDFVNIDQVADYETDCYDPYSHLNASGAQKVTDYLGRYITEHYDIADRREDPSVAHWHENYSRYMQTKREHLENCGDLGNMLMLLHDASFSAVVHLPEGSAAYDSDKLMLLLQNTAREHVFEEDMFSKYSNSLFPLERLDEAAQSGEAYTLIIDRENGLTEWVGTQDARCETSFGVCAMEDGALLLDEEPVFEEGRKDAGVLAVDAMTGEPAVKKTFRLY